MSEIIYDFKAIGAKLRKQGIDNWWQPAKPEPMIYDFKAIGEKLRKEVDDWGTPRSPSRK
jgi:hypothetical protein